MRTQMTSADLVSILRFNGGSVDVLQDFTADRNRLLSILQTLIVGEGQGSADSIDDASSADTGAAFGQDDSEFNIFNTDRQLSALQTAARMLDQMSEKKSLDLFRQRPAPERRRQHRAVARHGRRGGAGGGFLLACGRAGAGGRRAARRCNPGQCRQRGHVFRHGGGGLPPTGSSSRRTRCTRWPPTPAARRCSTTTT